MSFASLSFVAFLLGSLAVYYALRSRRSQIAWLILASYVFYGFWDWRFCGLLLTSTLVDYTAALRIGKPGAAASRRRLWLALSIATNLGILGFFKYANFFIESAESLLAAVGLAADTRTLAIILPIGISFYTFQSMGYTIDVFRGRLRPVRRFDVFALYVSYFPQLVAGPIERGERLLPQIERERRLAPGFVSAGLWLMLLGFFKKVVLADNLGAAADPIFDDPEAFAAGALLSAVTLFSLQIYLDFSGYSDIARGCSRLLGIELCVNFRQPYLSRNVSEFWRRWHVSLSTWLRDYLYVPLGGSRRGSARTACNLMTVMLLGGLWHGASWNFVAWGGIHGAYLIAHRLWRSPARRDRGGSRRWARMRELASTLAVFQLIAITWIFFRVPDFDAAWTILSGILSCRAGLAGLEVGLLSLGLGLTLALDQLAARAGHDDFPLAWPWTRQAAVYTSMIFALLLFGGTDAPFIYFQF